MPQQQQLEDMTSEGTMQTGKDTTAECGLEGRTDPMAVQAVFPVAHQPLPPPQQQQEEDR